MCKCVSSNKYLNIYILKTFYDVHETNSNIDNGYDGDDYMMVKMMIKIHSSS